MEAMKVTEQKAAAAEATTPAVLPKEVRLQIQQLFSMIDGDGDGNIDPAEMKRQHGGKDTGLFELIDVNGDGLVSLEEFEGFMQRQVSNNDAISPGSGIKRLVDDLEKIRASLQAKTDAVDSEKLMLLEAEVKQMRLTAESSQ